MTRIATEVGRFEVETSTDSWPLRILVKDRERYSELTGLVPEDLTDLIEALKLLQGKIAPILTNANLPNAPPMHDGTLGDAGASIER